MVVVVVVDGGRWKVESWRVRARAGFVYISGRGAYYCGTGGFEAGS